MNGKILIVEDEMVAAMGFQHYLESLGYDVIGIVSTGEDAIKIVTKLEVDLVLMDITLKGCMDGIETAIKIKSYIDIPVIYLTARLEKNIIKRMKFTSSYSYLVKPINKIELKKTIELALNKH